MIDGQMTSPRFRSVRISIPALFGKEGRPSGAPDSYRKEKKTNELIFSWVSVTVWRLRDILEDRLSDRFLFDVKEWLSKYVTN